MFLDIRNFLFWTIFVAISEAASLLNDENENTTTIGQTSMSINTTLAAVAAPRFKPKDFCSTLKPCRSPAVCESTRDDFICHCKNVITF
jgi:hypothetical protein